MALGISRIPIAQPSCHRIEELIKNLADVLFRPGGTEDPLSRCFLFFEALFVNLRGAICITNVDNPVLAQHTKSSSLFREYPGFPELLLGMP